MVAPKYGPGAAWQAATSFFLLCWFWRPKAGHHGDLLWSTWLGEPYESDFDVHKICDTGLVGTEAIPLVDLPRNRIIISFMISDATHHIAARFLGSSIPTTSTHCLRSNTDLSRRAPTAFAEILAHRDEIGKRVHLLSELAFAIPPPALFTAATHNIDTEVVDSLKVLDPRRPIREADIS